MGNDNSDCVSHCAGLCPGAGTVLATTLHLYTVFGCRSSNIMKVVMLFPVSALVEAPPCVVSKQVTR